MNAAGLSSKPGAGGMANISVAVRTLWGRLDSLKSAESHLMAAANTASTRSACATLVRQLESHQQQRARWEDEVQQQLEVSRSDFLQRWRGRCPISCHCRQFVWRCVGQEAVLVMSLSSSQWRHADVKIECFMFLARGRWCESKLAHFL